MSQLLTIRGRKQDRKKEIIEKSLYLYLTSINFCKKVLRITGSVSVIASTKARMALNIHRGFRHV